MFCPNCGSQMMDGTIFCTNCGSPMTPRSIIVRGERVIAALRDPLFLVICILWSISAVMTLFIAGFPDVITVLLTIFFWLTFAKARRGETPQNQLRCISGVVYAQYIIGFVASGVFFLLGVLMIVFGVATKGQLPELDSFPWEYFPNLFLDLGSAVFTVFFVIMGFAMFFGGGVSLVINLLGTRRIHRFAKSVYQNAYEDAPLPEAKAAHIWLMILGIISAVGVPNSLMALIISGSSLGGASAEVLVSALSMACSAAVSILASVLVKKYYCKATSVPGIPEEI